MYVLFIAVAGGAGGSHKLSGIVMHACVCAAAQAMCTMAKRTWNGHANTSIFTSYTIKSLRLRHNAAHSLWTACVCVSVCTMYVCPPCTLYRYTQVPMMIQTNTSKRASRLFQWIEHLVCELWDNFGIHSSCISWVRVCEWLRSSQVAAKLTCVQHRNERTKESNRKIFADDALLGSLCKWNAHTCKTFWTLTAAVSSSSSVYISRIYNIHTFSNRTKMKSQKPNYYNNNFS